MEICMKEYNLDSFQEKDLYSWEEIINKIEELESELKSTQEEFEDYKEYVKENYHEIPYSQQVGINDSDFI